MYVLIVFQVSLNFDQAKEILEIPCPTHVLINKMVISEENTSDNKGFHSIILQPFWFEPEQKKTYDNKSHEKETTEAVIHRYSSK